MMRYFAHRGLSNRAPENTMEAFDAAAAAGMDGIELDVQFSRDGRLVVIHDETLDRTTTGSGLVRDWDSADLRDLDAGRWFYGTETASRIPFLEEVLALVKSSGLWINIELKNGVFPYAGIEDGVSRLVRKFDLFEQTVISSYNHISLMTYRSIEPEAYLGALYDCVLVEPWNYAVHIAVDAVHPMDPAVSRETVIRCHELGIDVNVHTVDDPVRRGELDGWGVDGIFTNGPR